MGFKYGMIQSTMYRVSFLVELFVEFGYQTVSLLSLNVIFDNIKEVAGWDRYEMFVLYGFSLIVSQAYVGALGVWNLWLLPEKIKDGEIDFTLLKPINSQFSLSLGRPYFTSYLTFAYGFSVILIGLSKLNILLDPINILFGIIMFISGLVIMYSLTTMITSLSFVFINATNLPKLVGEVIYLKKYPHQVYQGFFKILFYFFIPIIFIASVPAEFIIKGVTLEYLVYGIGISIFLFFCSIKVWNKMIGFYTSASS